MLFDIDMYATQLATQLTELIQPKRLVFSVWNADFLVKKSCVLLSSMQEYSCVYQIEYALNQLWLEVERPPESIPGHEHVDLEDMIGAIRTVFESGQIALCGEILISQAIESVILCHEVVDRGFSGSAAMTAVCVVNYLDCLIGDDVGENYCEAVFEDQRFKEELEVHSKMIEFLKVEHGVVRETLSGLFRTW